MPSPVPFIDPSFDAITDNRKASWIITFADAFRECPVGKSFQVPLDVGTLGTVRSTVSSKFNKGEKKFRVRQHEMCYEIYRWK